MTYFKSGPNVNTWLYNIKTLLNWNECKFVKYIFNRSFKEGTLDLFEQKFIFFEKSDLKMCDLCIDFEPGSFVKTNCLNPVAVLCEKCGEKLGVPSKISDFYHKPLTKINKPTK